MPTELGERLIKEPCYIESSNITKNIARMIRYEIQRSQGIPVDDDLFHETEQLTHNHLKLKKCMLKHIK